MTARTRMSLLAAVATLAAATSLAPLFVDLRWFAPVVATVVAVALGGELCRRLRLPAPLGPVVSAGLVLIAATAMFASAGAYAGVIPSAASFRTMHLLGHSGFRDISTMVPPVPATRGLMLITAVGLAAIALLVDLFAVTMRRPSWAGLPLLAVFALATTLAGHRSEVVPFVIGAVGFLLLLLADGRERVLRWGRSVGPDRPAVFRTLPARLRWGAAGRRVGAAALGVAVVVPLALPTLHSRLIGRGGGGGTGTGGVTVTTFNPLVKIQSQLTGNPDNQLLRYRTNAAVPDYLRMTALDLFTGDTWSAAILTSGAQGRVTGGLPSLTTVSNAMLTASEVTTVVHVGSLDVHWLPLPQVPLNVQVHGDWRYDPPTNTLFSASSHTAGLSYQVISAPLVVDQTTLDEAAATPPAPPVRLDVDMQTPPDLDPRMAALAHSLTAHAHTELQAAIALQDYFADNPAFHYTLSVPNTDGSSALTTFLFSTHRGFCVQFAAAMAVLARLDGFPARVAVGFTPGARQPDGSYLVTAADAHAWPEVYFPGAGWLRFEPTPASTGPAQGVPPVYAAPKSSPSSPAPSAPTPVQQNRTGGLSGVGILRQGLTHSQGTAAPGAAGHGAGTGALIPVLVVAALLLVGIAPTTVDAVRRRRRWAAARAVPAARVHAAWADLHDRVVDLGLPWRQSDTPRSTGRRLSATARLDERGSVAVHRLARAEELARYAPRPPADVETLPAELAAARRSLGRGVSRRRRVLARLVRPSALRALRLATLGRLDRMSGRAPAGRITEPVATPLPPEAGDRREPVGAGRG